MREHSVLFVRSNEQMREDFIRSRLLKVSTTQFATADLGGKIAWQFDHPDRADTEFIHRLVHVDSGLGEGNQLAGLLRERVTPSSWSDDLYLEEVKRRFAGTAAEVLIRGCIHNGSVPYPVVQVHDAPELLMLDREGGITRICKDGIQEGTVCGVIALLVCEWQMRATRADAARAFLLDACYRALAGIKDEIRETYDAATAVTDDLDVSEIKSVSRVLVFSTDLSQVHIYSGDAFRKRKIRLDGQDATKVTNLKPDAYQRLLEFMCKDGLLQTEVTHVFEPSAELMLQFLDGVGHLETTLLTMPQFVPDPPPEGGEVIKFS